MTPIGVSTGVAIAYGVALWLLFLAPMAITALKGHWLLFAAGWITIGVMWWIAACRLARPGSWWARHVYGPGKLSRARNRYGEVVPSSAGEA